MLGRSLASQLGKNSQISLILANQVEVDWYSLDKVTTFFAKNFPDMVVCLLGKSGGLALNQAVPADLMLDNLLIILNVIRACHFLNIQKAIFLGSSCMYPQNNSQPMHEKLLFSGYLEPTSQSYAVAKLASFQLCAAFNQQYGRHFILVIPSSIYGPHDDFNPTSAHVIGALINKFHQAKVNQSSEITMWGSGLIMREFVYVADVAQAIIRCLAKDVTAKMNPINVGSGREVSIKALAEMIARTIGFSGKIFWDNHRPDGAVQKRLDSRQLASLGWSAQMNLEEGLALTYQWYVSKYAMKEVHDKISV